MPVLFESLLDSTLGGGELHGGGFFVLFLLYALGPQGLSASGGPGVSVPASLCSGASCSGPSCFVVLGSLGGLATGLAGPGMGSRLRGNDDLAGLRVSGSFLRGNDDLAGLRVNGAYNGLRPFDRLSTSGSFDGLRPFNRLRVSGSFDGAQDRLGTNGPFDRLGTSGVGCGAAGPAAPLGSRLRGNDG